MTGEISLPVGSLPLIAPNFLFSRFHSDPKKVKRCYRACRSTEEDFTKRASVDIEFFSSGSPS
jgi:hypothetical protein